MAKYLAIALIVALCLNMVLTNPLPEPEEQQGEIVRQKRVTCDLLSFEAGGVALNHSACAAHCLSLGRKGGYCNNGVCVCRN
ncbi:defensin-A-like [Onthophagus taurus]|uniref:defensin-A-like n=1 Tax=Onthophagus taurus TaxID=166361 RepID=UPI000C205874|nr:defensin-A-like [Onthophagus taurus]